MIGYDAAVQRIRVRAVSILFVLSVLAGVTLLSAAAFVLSLALGLASSGALLLAAGHWLTYLHMKTKAAV